MIYQNILECVGHTPMFRLSRLEQILSLKAKLFVKVESFNPTGSAKDRAALFMLQDALDNGTIQKNTVIIEPTSGNTGVSLAAFGAALGMRVIFTMPDSMSVERQMLLSAYGAEIVLTPGKDGMAGAIEKAVELQKSIPSAWIPGQFDNPSNKFSHYKTTGPEIWNDTEGEIDILVAGVGTGGTFSGTAAYLKEKKPSIHTVAVEPKHSPFLSERKKGNHGLMGIGAGFEPKNFDRSITDEIYTITEEEAYSASRALAKTEGILCGISSGAALSAAISIASLKENENKTVVVILPDTGERYLSTSLFQEK